MTRTSLSALCIGLTASASWSAERTLTGPEIQAALADNIFVSTDSSKDIQQIFQKSGLTLYSEGGAQSQGFWKVEGDGYCSVWPPSTYWACFTVTVDDK